MEDSDIVLDLIRCVSEEHLINALQKTLDLNMKVPDTAILRRAMDTSIRSAVETQNNKYFELAESLSKLIFLISPLNDDQRAALWHKITKENLVAILKVYMPWEKYFDFDIKRRKKLDAEQRHESMKLLYQAKQLSLFRAKHYPKVLFTMLKLGADPFEKKLARNKAYSKTLTYSIVKSRRLTKEKRIHLLHHLAEKNLLVEDPCCNSPVRICLQDQTRTHALPYIIRAVGAEKLQFGPSNNLLQELIKRANDYDVFMPHLTVQQFKHLLKWDGDYRPLYGLKHPLNSNHLENFVTAVKELLLENNDISVEKIEKLFPEEFLAPFTNGRSSPLMLEAQRTHWKSLEPPQTNDTTFNGNTEFPFEHLPLEISEMIFMHLPARDRAVLASVNKTMKKLPESFGEYFWKTTLKTAFPVMYSRLHNDASDRTWREKTESVVRATENLRKGKFTKKILKFKNNANVTGLQFDENWLCASSPSGLVFWNCMDDKIRYHAMPFVPNHVGYLNSTPDEIPSFVASSDTKFAYYVNYKSMYHTIAEFGIEPLLGIEYPSVAPLTPKTFIVGHMVFDIELQKVVATFPKRDILEAKKHIAGDYIISNSKSSINIYDEHLREVANMPTNRMEYQSIDILDEHLISATSPDPSRSAVIDIRTMKILHQNNRINSRFTNGAYRTITSDRGVGIVWNLRNNTWDDTFILPSGSVGNPILNSRYAAFSADRASGSTSMIVLDFDPRTN